MTSTWRGLPHCPCILPSSLARGGTALAARSCPAAPGSPMVLALGELLTPTVPCHVQGMKNKTLPESTYPPSAHVQHLHTSLVVEEAHVQPSKTKQSTPQGEEHSLLQNGQGPPSQDCCSLLTSNKISKQETSMGKILLRTQLKGLETSPI